MTVPLLVGAPDREKPDRQRHEERYCQYLHRNHLQTIIPLLGLGSPARGDSVGGMTPSVIQRWIDIVERDGSDDVEQLLADEAVFYSQAS
jgi:hypothetical protein